MPYGAGIQHPGQSPFFLRREPERLVPDFIIFHTKIECHIRGDGTDMRNDCAIETDAKRFEISHLAIHAPYEFPINDGGLVKPFFNNGF